MFPSSRIALHKINPMTFALSACSSMQVLLTRELSKGMIERNRGHIINVSSIAGHFSYPGGARPASWRDALLCASTAQPVDAPILQSYSWSLHNKMLHS